ncbi:MAG: porin family protein [Saprospiraceae bacterium]
MNKAIITLLLTVWFAESTFGQVNLGFSAGLNNSTGKVTNFEEIPVKGRFGYFVGIAPNYRISKKWQFQIDFQYSLKGFDIDNQGRFTAKGFRYGYLDMMPEIEYRLVEYLSLGLGVNYGIKLNEQFKIEDEDWSNSGDFEVINPTDFGLTGKLKVNYKNVYGFVRYNIGLTNIANFTFTDREGQNIDDAKQFNRNLQIGIGYTLNFRKVE